MIHLEQTGNHPRLMLPFLFTSSGCDRTADSLVLTLGRYHEALAHLALQQKKKRVTINRIKEVSQQPRVHRIRHSTEQKKKSITLCVLFMWFWKCFIASEPPSW